MASPKPPGTAPRRHRAPGRIQDQAQGRTSPARQPKPRADQLLVQSGLADNRSHARALILGGRVFLGETRIDKAGALLAADSRLSLRGPAHPWVSRGGIKLAHGLDHFNIDPAGRLCLDIGASTGGFTDVLLQRGAARVTAVDVGRGQLAWSLRQHPGVTVMERTNARYLDRSMLPEPVDILVCDASFIGLRTILPAPMALVADRAWLLALIKPQFEAGPRQVGRGGLVRDPAVHDDICTRIGGWLDGLPGWRVAGITPSPIAGGSGNREFLIAARYRRPGPAG